jgi:hypothetical protein
MFTVRSLGLFFSSLLVACSDGFDPYSELSSLRVLAVASQPAMPRPGVSAKLSALVYAPPGQDVTYRWSLCPVVAKAKDAYACPITPEAAAAVFGGGLPVFELGSTPEVTLTHGLAPATLAGLCARGIAAAGYADSVDCDLGFPISVVLDVGSGDKSLRAGFVVYLPTSDDAGADNHNPTILDLTADGVSVGEALAALPGAKLSVGAAVAADAVERRPAFPFESGTESRLERLTFSWFADTGSWNKDRTSFIDGETTLADASANPWTAPDVLPGSATFAVVVRDDRGGVGWLQRKPSLGGQP